MERKSGKARRKGRSKARRKGRRNEVGTIEGERKGEMK
jgi:hypothetical protein